MKKKERLLIGKRIHEGESTVPQCVEAYRVSSATAYR